MVCFKKDGLGIIGILVERILTHLRLIWVGSFSLSHSSFFSLSGRSQDIAEILLTGTLSLHLTN